MKCRIFTLALASSFIILAGNAAAETKTESINFNGTNRSYITYVPEDLGPKRPLLVSMHGMNQDAGYQKGMLQIESIADTAKFVTIFPEGLNRSWDISGTNDINFVLKLIDVMAEKYDIDKNRVYLSGFSMGGMFTYHAMNHIADKIAAFAPISGYPMGGQPFTSSRPVPIIHTHGTSDDVVGFSGVQRSLDGWIERNGCSPTALVTKQYRYNGCTRHQWGPGDEGAEVVLIERADKGHWIANDVFYSGEEIWNFCKRYSLGQEKPSVTVKYPNGGAEVTALGTNTDILVHIEAKGSSKNSTVESMAVYADDELVGTFEGNSVVYEWPTTKGQHFIKVVATDAEGVSVARATVVDVKIQKTSINFSSKFKTGGTVPEGWITYDSKKLVTGETTGLTSGNRIIHFTGDPVDFEYGFYFTNISGKTDKGYAIYADKRSDASLMLSPAAYELTFDACNFDMEGCGEIRCKVFEAYTGEVIAETSVMPTVNIGGNAKNPFSGASSVVLPFDVNENVLCSIGFYTANEANADAVIGNAKIKKVGASGIEAVECAAEGQPVAVEYYDFLGRKLVNAHGAAIRRTVLSSGAVRTEKVLIK